MVRARPKRHNEIDDQPPPLDINTKELLLRFFDSQNAEQEERCNFIGEILVPIYWAAQVIKDRRHMRTAQEVQAEYSDWLKNLRRLEKKLRSPSDDLLVSLPLSVEPRKHADNIRNMIQQLTDMIQELEAAMNGVYQHQKSHGEKVVAEEFTLRVSRVLSEYGIPVAATLNQDKDEGSSAVELLTDIGNSIGLPRSKSTWRDAINNVKSKYPDL